MPKKGMTVASPSAISPVTIEGRIHLIRGQRVMLDSDLAEMYGVETGVLNQAVTRNASRFPADFAFILTAEELESLRSQIVISKSPAGRRQAPYGFNDQEVERLRSQIVTSKSRGGRRYSPRVFTEQGVAMLSSVLRSRRAIDVNIAIMRAFVQLREMLTSHKDLARRIDELEQKYDGSFAAVFDAIRELASPPADEEVVRSG